jgi:ferrous-iron efflux pump FieF
MMAETKALSPEKAAKLMRLASMASISVAGTLIAVKLAALLLTHSVSLLASLVDSLTDSFASLINFIAIRHALMPPDREHRFGHGKAEPLAALAQSAFMTGSAIFVLIAALQRLLNPTPLNYGTIGLVVMGISIALTFFLVAFEKNVARQTGSMVIQTDSLHYEVDLWTNAAVFLSIGASTFWQIHILDPVAAFGITGYLLWNTYHIAVHAIQTLMDREFSEQEGAEIRAIALSHHGALGVHDLRTRRSGPSAFIQVHLEMEDSLPLIHAHKISDDVEAAIRRHFTEAEVIIHEDPQSVAEHLDRPEAYT